MSPTRRGGGVAAWSCLPTPRQTVATSQRKTARERRRTQLQIDPPTPFITVLLLLLLLLFGLLFSVRLMMSVGRCRQLATVRGTRLGAWRHANSGGTKGRGKARGFQQVRVRLRSIAHLREAVTFPIRSGAVRRRRPRDGGGNCANWLGGWR